MVKFSQKTKQNKIIVEIETNDLSPANVRLMKSLNTLLYQLLTTAEEPEFFKGAAEALRTCASLIQQSKFTELHSSSDIPYAQQALEYSMDILQEQLVNAKVVRYDN